ncbi:hypothetical protein C8F04DRAFT_1263383 [Mycena alexandri]|uniref:Uncharacterized protein n=1 Tax=Mycena alexandri TaxID=1745969 RepID=A0AAD6WZE0_9AGAR|nr:hypothetical protein C8F04DRAFT_1263383 [Mycena alexandri]
MPPKMRCQPRYFPQPGHEDTVAHDGRKDGRYFVVGAGHCGNGVFTDAHVADMQTNGFSGYAKRSTKRWTGVNGVEDLWAAFCDEFHRDGCHTARLPDGWDAPVPVRLVDPLVFPAPATSASAVTPTDTPHTPRPTTKSGGSGNTWASPLVVRSSVSPSPLRPPPQYHHTSGSPRPRTALNPSGSAPSTMSAASSVLSAMTTSSAASSFSFSQGSASARTPKKTVHSRVRSSPNAEHDTDFYFDDDDSDEEDGAGAPQASQARRLWAVRGLDELFHDVDSAFDALRQNMDRLKYMEVRTSTNPMMLRQFAAS